MKCIEHGHLMDEATAKLMAEKGVWLSIQPFPRWPWVAGLGPAEQDKLRQVLAGTDRVYQLAKKYKHQDGVRHRRAVLAGARRAAGRDAGRADPLVHAGRSADDGDGDQRGTARLSGLRNPYPGKLGVVEEGALADLLLVDGNPLENIALVEDPAKNFVVIMKDGKVFKNALRR